MYYTEMDKYLLKIVYAVYAVLTEVYTVNTVYTGLRKIDFSTVENRKKGYVNC